MGRRKKAAKKVVKKKRLTVSKSFKCLFCSTDKSVACILDSKAAIGKLQCGTCKAQYRTKINSLSEPIDVFTEWLDATHEANSKGFSNNLQIDATGEGFSDTEINPRDNENARSIELGDEDTESDED